MPNWLPSVTPKVRVWRICVRHCRHYHPEALAAITGYVRSPTQAARMVAIGHVVPLGSLDSDPMMGHTAAVSATD